MHATQFYEFLTAIADASTIDGKVHLIPVHFQPMASDDVVSALGRVTVGDPLNAIQELGGPEKVRMDELIRVALEAAGDEREIVSDEHAKYFGTELRDDSLVPGPGAVLGSTTYADWASAKG